MDLDTGIYLRTSKVRAFALISTHLLVSLPTPSTTFVSLNSCSQQIDRCWSRKVRQKTYWFLLCSCSQIPVWAVTGLDPWVFPGICLYRSLPGVSRILLVCFWDVHHHLSGPLSALVSQSKLSMCV